MMPVVRASLPRVLWWAPLGEQTQYWDWTLTWLFSLGMRMFWKNHYKCWPLFYCASQTKQLPMFRKHIRWPYFRISQRISKIEINLTNCSIFSQLFLFSFLRKYNREHHLIYSLNYVYLHNFEFHGLLYYIFWRSRFVIILYMV